MTYLELPECENHRILELNGILAVIYTILLPFCPKEEKEIELQRKRTKFALGLIFHVHKNDHGL